MEKKKKEQKREKEKKEKNNEGKKMRAYDELKKTIKKAGILNTVHELLDWDQEVTMPKGASWLRAIQRGTISEVAHEIFTQKKVGELIKEAEKEELNEEEKALVREVKKKYERATKVPSSLIKEITETSARATEKWKEAREKNEYEIFKPELKKIIELQKEYAKLINPDKNPYEVLIEDYESDIPYEEIKKNLEKIKEESKELLKKIKEKEPPRTDFLTKEIEEEKQLIINKTVAATIGYDFEKGRLDLSVHPFTGAYGRITTRTSEGWLEAITGTIHEAGHGMYEHGLREEEIGTPLGEPSTLSVHESQSRIWENNIGRSKEFWEYFWPRISKEYGLEEISVEEIYRAVNIVKPSLIRVEADEVTYPLHIILRFEIEDDLINGRITVDELPTIWNNKMKELLGIIPPNNKLGVLQDIHWSMGSIGYFPTYALGTMIAAQLYEKIKKDIPTMKEEIRKGEFKRIKEWLKEKIHQQGRKYEVPELIRRATGKEISSEDYIKYLKEKYKEIYGIE